MAAHNELGKLGEEMAIEHLLQKGYTILHTNWTFQKAEVDILAQQDSTLAVIEVKTRTTSHFGDPQDFVTQKKNSAVGQSRFGLCRTRKPRC